MLSVVTKSQVLIMTFDPNGFILQQKDVSFCGCACVCACVCPAIKEVSVSCITVTLLKMIPYAYKPFYSNASTQNNNI